MKTYPLMRDDGSEIFAFEVENTFLSPAAVARIVAGVEGVSDVRARKMFSKSSDVHVEFKFRGQSYIVWEPFGDNSRYWVGPKDDARKGGEVRVLEIAFKRYRPFVHRLLGGVGMRFLTRKQ